MRLFIAIEIPEGLRSDLVKVSEILQRDGLAYGNFVSKDNIHLTLRFIGDEMSEEDLENIKALLGKVNFSKFNLMVKDYGFFPTENYIKVFWAGVESDKVLDLQGEVERILVEGGFQPDKNAKDFHPHLTLARIKGLKDREIFKEKLNSIWKLNHEFEINEFALIKSELTKQGPIYKKLASFKLK